MEERGRGGVQAGRREGLNEEKEMIMLAHNYSIPSCRLLVIPNSVISLFLDFMIKLSNYCLLRCKDGLKICRVRGESHDKKAIPFENF